jgi:hypothetical protein
MIAVEAPPSASGSTMHGPRSVVAFLGCCILAACGEVSFLDHDDWSLTFLNPQPGAVLTAGDGGLRLDVMVEASGKDDGESVQFASARLQVRLGSETTNAAPIVGDPDGGLAVFPNVALPIGDVLLDASATDLDRSTTDSAITVHVQ